MPPRDVFTSTLREFAADLEDEMVNGPRNEHLHLQELAKEQRRLNDEHAQRIRENERRAMQSFLEPDEKLMAYFRQMHEQHVHVATEKKKTKTIGVQVTFNDPTEQGSTTINAPISDVPRDLDVHEAVANELYAIADRMMEAAEAEWE